MERYETGYQLMQAGVVCGYDSTTESAVTKLMFLLGHGYTPEEVRKRMRTPMAGEITTIKKQPISGKQGFILVPERGQDCS